MKIIVMESTTDGAGKQTQSRLLKEHLINMDFKVASLSFPNYDSRSSGPVKMYLNGEIGSASDVNPYVSGLAYAVDRAFTMIQFAKSAGEYDFLILDRYAESNFFYQTIHMDETEAASYITRMQYLEHEVLGCPRADLVLVLDLPPHIAAKNRSSRALKNGQDRDILEEDERQESVYRNSLRVIDALEATRIACSDDDVQFAPSQIHEEIFNEVCTFFNIERRQVEVSNECEAE